LIFWDHLLQTLDAVLNQTGRQFDGQRLAPMKEAASEAACSAKARKTNTPIKVTRDTAIRMRKNVAIQANAELAIPFS
jgi:hypothetical protein